MNEVIKSVDEIIPGQVIIDSIYCGKLLVCKENTPVTLRLIELLKAYNIEQVKVSSIFTETIDSLAMDFNKLNEVTRIALKSLAIDDIIVCAKHLVTNMIETGSEEIASLLYTHDAGTIQHAKNVAVLALSCGIKLGWNKDNMKSLTLGALLHDLGKTGIPADILQKNGRLSEAEYLLIKQHPITGHSLITQSKICNSAIAQIVLQHHENYDGSGYPRGLYGIHSYRSARLVHICDVYEALTAKRSYKEPMNRIEVREFMRTNSRKMFDPILLKAFLNTVPAYFVGEEVVSNGKVGVVASNVDLENPTLLVDNENVLLSDFVQDTHTVISLDYINLVC